MDYKNILIIKKNRPELKQIYINKDNYIW